MYILIFIINYILILLFLNSYYLIYFIALILLSFLQFKFKFIKNKYMKVLVVLFMFVTVFAFEYFDDNIFDIYLYFNIDAIYRPLSGDIKYILILLHSFILFGL